MARSHCSKKPSRSPGQPLADNHYGVKLQASQPRRHGAAIKRWVYYVVGLLRGGFTTWWIYYVVDLLRGGFTTWDASVESLILTV